MTWTHAARRLQAPTPDALALVRAGLRGEDDPRIAAKGIAAAQPTGSAMPLVWAHSEYRTLPRSLRDDAVFYMLPQDVKRYIEDKTVRRCVPGASTIKSAP